MNPYEEKLQRMLEEGKVTPAQYEELRANLPGEEPQPPRPENAPPGTAPGPLPPPPLPPRFSAPHPAGAEETAPLPWQVLACAVFLFIVGVVGFMIDINHIEANRLPGLIIASLLNFAAGFALLKRIRWVYIPMLILVLLAMIVNLAQGILAAFFINGIFLSLLLNAWRFFCPDRSPGEALEAGWQSVQRTLNRDPFLACPLPLKMLAGFLILEALHVFFIGALTPGQRIAGAAIDLLFCLFVLRQNRIALIILSAFTVYAFFYNLIRMAIFSLLIVSFRGGALLWFWRTLLNHAPADEPSRDHSDIPAP